MENKSLFDLTGKIALITGGAGLLASEHAQALLEFGATIILADIREEKCKHAVKILNKKYEKVFPVFLDVTKKESWESVLENIQNTFGQIDILINNAGFTNQSKTSGFDASFENFSLEDWNAILQVNLTGTFLGCQVIGKHMVEHKKGAIINMASLYGVVSPHHPLYEGTGIVQPVAYSVSKHGVIGLTKYIATLWAKKGVRVNSITPGGIFNGHEGLFLERFEKLNPIGRMSDQAELRGAVVFLASDASSHVIGHNLIVDGGWTAW
ncbi:MAG: SDR family oxidoreductase [Bacteroidetes bacterium]|nr:SDR family oxidoreductase [Bacteroidota bacterium]